MQGGPHKYSVNRLHLISIAETSVYCEFVNKACFKQRVFQIVNNVVNLTETQPVVVEQISSEENMAINRHGSELGFSSPNLCANA